MYYRDKHDLLMKSSWALGMMMRKYSMRYYGSTWNTMWPVWDEWRLAAQTGRNMDVTHFMWGEFASPAHPDWFRKRAKIIVGTFHASARRLPEVLRGFRCFDSYDAITLMSRTQLPYFMESGIPEEKLRVILHGVDSRYFRPLENRPQRDGPLQGILVGKTERDHGMLAEILKKIPEDVLTMRVLTPKAQQAYYYDDTVPYVEFPEFLSDDSLVAEYQRADLLVMPLLDCTANNALLESMACGTPVMVNRVGGVSEYVDESCNIIVDHHSVDDWVDRLIYWRQQRRRLESMRQAVRRWAVAMDWGNVAPKYLEVYRTTLERMQ